MPHEDTAFPVYRAALSEPAQEPIDVIGLARQAGFEWDQGDSSVGMQDTFIGGYENVQRLIALVAQLPASPEVCSVCSGTGKPISGKVCICGGLGTIYAEMDGLRKALYEASPSEAGDAVRWKIRAEWLLHNAGQVNAWAQMWSPESSVTCIRYLELLVDAAIEQEGGANG